MCFMSTEWRNASERAKRCKKRHGFEAEFKFYYEKLKDSVARVEKLPSSTKVFKIQELPEDEQLLLDEIKKICEDVRHLARIGTAYYYHLGYALAKLKIMYVEECSICRETSHDSQLSQETRMFAILSCQRCCKRGRGTKHFFDITKEELRYKKAYINFLIRAAKLITKYPKLRYIQWNANDMKKFMTYLEGYLEKDGTFWCQNDSQYVSVTDEQTASDKKSAGVAGIKRKNSGMKGSDVQTASDTDERRAGVGVKRKNSRVKGSDE